MSQMDYTVPVVVDLANDSTVVLATPGRLYGMVVNTGNSAQPVAIQNNSVTLMTLPASMAAGVYQSYPGVLFDHDITVIPNAAATGSITLFYRPGRSDNILGGFP